MSPEDWKCLFKGSMSGKSLVKLAGFDGGSGTSCPVWDKVNVELESKDVLLWDGDWYNDEGWTKVIPEFLAVSQERIAIAFQKRKEVPGFHRSYWHLYKRFPGRIQMVVMEDQENMDAVPPAVKAQLKWLDEEFQSSRLKKPTTWEGAQDRYLMLALCARWNQGRIPVVAVGGGRVAAAQAVVDTCMADGPRIPWMVFPRPLSTVQSNCGKRLNTAHSSRLRRRRWKYMDPISSKSSGQTMLAWTTLVRHQAGRLRIRSKARGYTKVSFFVLFLFFKVVASAVPA